MSAKKSKKVTYERETKERPYVQILFSPKIDQLSLDELIRLQQEIKLITRKPPKPDCQDLNHDVWKFTNNPKYDDSWLRIYVKKTRSEGYNDDDELELAQYTYRAEIVGLRDSSSRFTTCLAVRNYSSEDFKRTPRG